MRLIPQSIHVARVLPGKGVRKPVNRKSLALMGPLSGMILAAFSGCNLLLMQLGLLSGGGLVPPEYEGLEGQRVAVVCVSDSAIYGVGHEAELLARSTARMLGDRVKKIEIIRHDEIDDWIDKNDWNELDYREVGKGVKADRVVAIDLAGFRLHESQTLYRGQASVTVKVLDMTQGGKEVFRRTLPDIKFPANGVYHSTETTEEAFRRAFLQVISQQVSRFFFEHDLSENFGRDPATLG